jgi:hypothetical protein
MAIAAAEQLVVVDGDAGRTATLGAPVIDPAEHRGLAVSLAKKFIRRAGAMGVPLDDLVGEALLGLVLASRKFDPGRGAVFGTFATMVIRHRLEKFLPSATGGAWDGTRQPNGRATVGWAAAVGPGCGERGQPETLTP